VTIKKDVLVPLEIILQRHKDEVVLEALELAVLLWPAGEEAVTVLEPEVWVRLRRFLLDIPEILGV
jgi:hypothetical protein